MNKYNELKDKIDRQTEQIIDRIQINRQIKQISRKIERIIRYLNRQNR